MIQGFFYPVRTGDFSGSIFFGIQTLTRSEGKIEKSETLTRFSLMNDIKSDVRNRIGNSLIDLMLIAMYGDEHEFDYDILGEYVAENIWHYKKA